MQASLNPNLVFLKLGGSLITDKTRAHTARPDTLARLAEEIAQARAAQPALQMVLGHGSGSFGHTAARRHGTRQGVSGPEQWQGFVEVWREAAALNHLVMEALAQAGLPAIAFPPSASVLAQAGRLVAWDLAPIQAALQAGLMPVVFGDVVFDQSRGGVILSTEELFEHLAPRLRPVRLLLAGIEAGVWADFPACHRLILRITPASQAEASAGLGGSAAVDVTGGMLSKVQQSLALAQTLPGLQVWIFSGEEAGTVQRALAGERQGTVITGDGGG